MKYDSIIFDIDGTLWNATGAVTRGWNKGLEILGLPERVAEKDIKKVMGTPYKKCVDILLPGLRKKYPNLLGEISRQTYQILNAEGAELYNGVCEGIKELSASYKLFLISNCEPDYLEIFLELSNLGGYFTGRNCYGASRISKDKMILNFKEKHSLKKTAYTGDTAGDQKAAKLAGVDFIFVSYGFGEVKEADPKFDNFPDLVNYLTRL